MKKEFFGISYDVEKHHKIYGVKTIPIPLYRCEIKLFFGKQTEELEKLWKNDLNYDGNVRDYLDTCREVLITFPTENPNVASVVHELCHATQIILKNIGHNYYNQNSDEPFAYLLTYLIQEYQKIKKFK